MNNVNIIGNITRDIELINTQAGMAIAKFGIAVNKKVKNQQGGYDDKAHFFDITAFAKTAENINQYFRKGSKIGISGELNFEQWEDQQGQKRSKVSIICNQFDFIDKKDDQQQAPQQQQQQNQQNPTYGQPQQQQQQAPQQQQMNYGGQQQQQQYQQPNQQQQNQQQSGRQPVAEDEIPF